MEHGPPARESWNMALDFPESRRNFHSFFQSESHFPVFDSQNKSYWLLSFASIALCLNIATAQEAAQDSWSLFRGNPQSTGVAQTTLPEKLELLWEYKIEKGAFEAAAVIENGVAYIGDLDGLLIAINMNDGKEIWRYKSKSDIGFAGSPGVKDGKVYAGDLDGLFCCVNAENGNCLLYTSPSPRDRTRSRMPSSA